MTAEIRAEIKAILYDSFAGVDWNMCTSEQYDEIVTQATEFVVEYLVDLGIDGSESENRNDPR